MSISDFIDYLVEVKGWSEEAAEAYVEKIYWW